MTDATPRWWDRHPAWAAALLVALVALASSATGLGNGFAYDDIFIVRDNPAVNTLRGPLAYFQESYWGPARGHVALYRPLTVWSYALQWAAGGGAPFIFHALNVTLYVGTSLLVLALLRALVPAGAALLGAALFAAHPVHVEAVANVVGQAELGVALLLLASVALYLHARRRGDIGIGTGAAIAACYVTSLFIKENGIVLPALLLATEAALPWTGVSRSTDTWRRTRLLVLTLGLIAALYLLWRGTVLGALTGDEPFWGLRYLGAGARALVMLGLVPELARLLFWPARLYADYSPQMTPLHAEWSLAHLPGLALLALVAAAAWWAWRRREGLVLLALAWFGITYLPIANLLYPTGVLIAERTLFLPSLAVVFAAARLAATAPTWRRELRSAGAAVAIGALLLAVGRSATRSPTWADNPTLFSVLAIEAPNNFRAPFALAEFNALGGRPQVADTLFRRALALYPEHVPARLSYGQVLQIQRRCTEALPLFESAMRDDPDNRTAVIGTVICYLDLQRFEDARRLALIGNASGWEEPRLRDLRIVAESVLVAMDTVDARNRFARSGRPFARTGLPLRIEVYRDEQARRERMQRLTRSASDSRGASPDSLR